MLSAVQLFNAKIHTPLGAQYAFIALSGLGIFAHIAFIAPAMYFLFQAFSGQEKVVPGFWFEKYSDLFVWLPALFVIFMFTLNRPAPLDDLLAISSIAAGSFSHDSFEFSDWASQPASPWHGFELALGFAGHHFGHDNAMQFVQWLSVAFTSASITLAIQSRMKGRSDLVWNAAILIVLAMASMAVGRAMGGRIETFFFAWAIAAFWMPTTLWLAIGVALSPMYWLAWIYAPAALLLKASLRRRLVIGGVYFAISVGIWLSITEWHYINMFELTSQWLSARQTMVSENIPLLSGVGGSPAVLFLLAATGIIALAGKGLREEWPMAAVAIWFTLPDMIRYLPIIAAIMAVWIMGVRARDQTSPLSTAMLLALLVPLFVAFTHTLPVAGMDKLPKFDIPRNAVVLGPLNQGIYAAVHFNPGIKVAPSFELGATDIAIQRAVVDMQSKGHFDCSILYFYAIDYVLDNQMNSIPPCLHLDQVQGSWRLWKTDKAQSVGSASK